MLQVSFVLWQIRHSLEMDLHPPAIKVMAADTDGLQAPPGLATQALAAASPRQQKVMQSHPLVSGLLWQEANRHVYC